MMIIHKNKKTATPEKASDVSSKNFHHNFKIVSKPDLPPEKDRNNYYSNGMRRVRKLLNLINR